MGATIWVDVEGRKPNDLPADNSLILRLEKQLAKLSKKLGVAKLADYYDYSAMEEAMADLLGEGGEEDEEPADDDSEPTPEGNWFDPAPALAAVVALHEHLTEHPEQLGKFDKSRLHWPEGAMEELRHCRDTLEQAMKSRKRFRFLLVP